MTLDNSLIRALFMAAALTLTLTGPSPLQAQVRFAPVNGSADDIRQSVDSVTTFIQQRSSIEFSEAMKQRLAKSEQRTVLGKNRRLSADDLIDVLTQTALARLRTLTAQEIEQARAIYQKSYETDRSYAGLTWGEIEVTPREFASGLRLLRGQSRSSNKELSKVLRQFVAGHSEEDGVNAHLQLYSRVLPAQFGSVFQTGLTPLQAVLVAYAMVSDDPIHLKTSVLEGEMMHAHEWIGGASYPDVTGRCAFGVNGYLFATPVDLFFNDSTLNQFLELIDRRTAY